MRPTLHRPFIFISSKWPVDSERESMIDPSKYTVRETLISLSNGINKLCDNNPMRICILFGSNITGTTRLSTRSDATTNQGIAISTDGSPVVIHWNTHGSLSTVEWFTNTSFGMGNFATVIEVIELPDRSECEESNVQRGNPNWPVNSDPLDILLRNDGEPDADSSKPRPYSPFIPLRPYRDS